MGNRLTSSATTGSWSYNQNNELQGYDDTTYVHDADGNITQKTAGSQTTKYLYDPEGRLIEVRDASDALIAKYTYDPFGRRLTKEVSGQKTYYLYSDEGLIGEYDAAGQEIRTYGYRPDARFSTDPVFQKSGGTYYFYQNDHLGTPQKLVTSNGSVVWSATYDSFGNAQVGTSTVTNNLRFAGQYFDAETGLHYNLIRYYDPATGRYLGRDPLGQGDNLYAYAFNNPLSFIDPEGLCALGAGLGSESAQWYADRFNETGDWYYYVGGFFASLWTHETWLETATVLIVAESYARHIDKPFWRYTGPESNPNSPWVTRGHEPPYGTDFVRAKDRLQMPNLPTNVEKVKVPWYEPIRGPRPAVENWRWGTGGGPEYYRGWRWPKE